MTTPAQYEEAIRALEDVLTYAGDMEPPMALGDSDRPALESALAIVREAREREAWWNLCLRGEWFRHDGRTHLAIRMADDADLSTFATTEAAMREAITSEVPDAR